MRASVIYGSRHNPDAPPFTRNGRCAYLGCPKSAIRMRETNGGWWVGYCDFHELAASLVFDRADEAAA